MSHDHHKDKKQIVLDRVKRFQRIYTAELIHQKIRKTMVISKGGNSMKAAEPVQDMDQEWQNKLSHMRGKIDTLRGIARERGRSKFGNR
jgi:hypothetical protein